MTHRFFISPIDITPPTVQLEGRIARQIRTVLRMRPGDEITVLDNSGKAWQVVLTEVGKSEVQGKVIREELVGGEPKLKLTLYQGTLKASKFEWVLQKGTELGVSGFAPTICRRSVVSDPAALVKKHARWQQIIREAAEQSGRGKLPHLGPALSLSEAIAQAKADQNLIVMPWEEAEDAMLKTVLSQFQGERIALFIGPEGGLTAAEVRLGQQAGAEVVSLGSRILRAETAAIAASAAIFYELEG